MTNNHCCSYKIEIQNNHNKLVRNEFSFKNLYNRDHFLRYHNFSCIFSLDQFTRCRMHIRACSTWKWHYFRKLCCNGSWYFLELRSSGNRFHRKWFVIIFTQIIWNEIFYFLLMNVWYVGDISWRICGAFFEGNIRGQIWVQSKEKWNVQVLL